MLQASEYNIRNYLRWYHTTKNFTHVEKRKQLVKTPKALVLLSVAWIIVLSLLYVVLCFVWRGTAPLNYIFSLLILLFAPYALAYGIATLLLVGTICIQWPAHYFIIKKARRRLAAHKAFKIAIAGSFGKTSMREIIKTVVGEGKRVATPGGSHNTPLGISAFIRNLKGDKDVLIFELGEYYPGDVRALCELVQPDLGIITGVNEAHLQKFKSLDATTRTIFELAQWLGKKPLYVNAENKLAREYASKEHIRYTSNGIGEWKALDPHTDLSGTSFVLSMHDQKLKLTSKLLGLHQIGPLLAACAIAARLGIPFDKIQKGIAKT